MFFCCKSYKELCLATFSYLQIVNPVNIVPHCETRAFALYAFFFRIITEIKDAYKAKARKALLKFVKAIL